MMAGPQLLIACPTCKYPGKQSTWLSGNTFDATWWTDGLVRGSMLPDPPQLTRCKKCRSIFWIHEAPQIGKSTDPKPEDPLHEMNVVWNEAKFFDKPTEDDCLEAIENGLARDQDSLLNLRLRAWWAANEKYRKNDEAEVLLSDQTLGNLKALTELLDEQDPKQLLLKAEAFRELSEYQMCLHMLSHIEERNGHTWFSKIHELATARESRVAIHYDNSFEARARRNAGRSD